jgi:hypothetical protein
MTPMPIRVTARSPHLAASRLRHDTGERVVRLADGLLDGADGPGLMVAAVATCQVTET